MRRSLVLLVSAFLLVFVGCAKPAVWEPPRIDLHRYGTFGLVELDAAGGDGASATRQILAALHAAQPGVPVLELGPLPELLRAVGHDRLDPTAARAIAQRFGVDALLVGRLEVERPRAGFSVQSFTDASASAEMHGQLSARILDATSGATIWSDEARGSRTIAHVGLSAGSRPEFGAADPGGEQSKLVDSLVARVTDDFRGRWTRP